MGIGRPSGNQPYIRYGRRLGDDATVQTCPEPASGADDRRQGRRKSFLVSGHGSRR